MDTTKSAADWADAHWSPLTGEGTELTSFNTWHHRRFGFVDHRNVTCASRWAIWQASREAVVVELPGLTDELLTAAYWDFDARRKGYPPYTAPAGQECGAFKVAIVSAIEAQGLKVAP